MNIEERVAISIFNALKDEGVYLDQWLIKNDKHPEWEDGITYTTIDGQCDLLAVAKSIMITLDENQ